MVKTLATAVALIVASAEMTLAQDVEKGAAVFKKCAICHKIGPGATNLVGPELNGLDDRKSGSVPGISYSDAIRIPASSGMNRLSKITSRTRKRRSPALKWYSLASRTNRKQRICGRTSNSSILRATLRSKRRKDQPALSPIALHP